MYCLALVLAGEKVLYLGETEDRPVTAHVDITNIAPATLADTALHPLFQGGYHLLRREA